LERRNIIGLPDERPFGRGRNNVALAFIWRSRRIPRDGSMMCPDK